MFYAAPPPYEVAGWLTVVEEVACDPSADSLSSSFFRPLRLFLKAAFICSKGETSLLFKFEAKEVEEPILGTVVVSKRFIYKVMFLSV